MTSIIRRVTDKVGLTSPIHTSKWDVVPDLFEGNVVEGVFAQNAKYLKDTDVVIIDGLTGRETTRAQLVSRVKQIAYSLKHDFKRSEGEAVAVFSPNSDTFSTVVLGILAGALIATPANAMYGPEELQHQLEETGTVTLFVHPLLLDTALKTVKLLGWSDQQVKERLILAVFKGDVQGEAAKHGFKTLDDLLNGKELDIVKISDPKDTVAVMSFSSGTTGKAKAVQNTHYNMSSILAISYPFSNALGPRDKVIHLGVLPFSHIYAFALNVLSPLWLAQPIVVIPRFEPDLFFSLIQKYKITALWIVPPIGLLIARDPRVAKYDLTSVTFCNSGAAPFGAGLIKEVSAKLPNATATQGYGLSEMSPATHFCPPDAGKEGSIGRLLPNLEARLVDPVSLKDVTGRGEAHTGELWVRGPTRMKGYLKRPEETAATIVEDGWLRTGDVAYIDNDDYYFIADRLKELIKYKGYPVPPAELEALLLGHPKVKDVAVIGIYSEEEVTELPRAYVVKGPGAENDDDKALEKEIQEWTAKKVAQHKRLRGGVKFVQEIPKSPSGKILRRVLKDQLKAEQTIKPKL